MSLPFKIRAENSVRMKRWSAAGVLTLYRTSGRETGKFQGQGKKEMHQDPSLSHKDCADDNVSIY